MRQALAVVAHQGGWDEILLVAGPIVLVVGLLVLARRRLRRAAPATVDDAASRPAQDGAASPAADGPR